MNLNEFMAYLQQHDATRKWASVFNEVMGETRPTLPGSTRRTTTAEQ